MMLVLMRARCAANAMPDNDARYARHARRIDAQRYDASTLLFSDDRLFIRRFRSTFCHC